MEQYKFAKINSTKSGIRLSCTDKTDLDVIIAQLKNFSPKMLLEETQKLPSGEIYGYLIKGLPFDYDDVRWWVIKYFCSQGWEPFDVASVSSEGLGGVQTTLHYHFRCKVSI
jgi:hypothetical protein